MAKAPPYDGLTAEMPVADAARRIVRALLAAVLQRIPEVLLGEDARAVHDTRVAIRRLRSAMATFGACFPQRRWRRLRRAVRRLGRKLGAVRDADVHLAALRTALGEAPPGERPGIAYVVEALVERRQCALGEFALELSQLDRERFARLLGVPERTYALSARRFVRKGLRRLLNDASQALESGGDAELHALRIHTKLLRYRLEFAAPLLADRARTPLRQLALLQDALGALADAANFARTYAALLDGLAPGDARRLGLDELHDAARRDRERGLTALRALWYGPEGAARADVPASTSAASGSASPVRTDGEPARRGYSTGPPSGTRRQIS